MAMVCSLSFFASCSSNSDDNSTSTPSVWTTFKGGEYSVWGDDLYVSDDSVSYRLLDLTMNVAKAGDSTAVVTLKAAGDSAVINVPAATVAATKDGYTLNGKGTLSTKTQAASDVTISAKISADNQTAYVELSDAKGHTAAFTTSDKPAMAKLMNNWYTEKTKWFDEDGNEVEAGTDKAVYAEGSFKFNWKVKDGTSIDFGGYPMPVSTIVPLAERMANAKIYDVLRTVAFTRSGDIIAQYFDMKENKWKIAQGYATYKVVTEDQIVVFLDTDKILSTVTDATDKAALTAILGIFKETGIPVHIEFSTDNQAFFYLNKTFAQRLAQDETMKALVSSIKDEDLEGMGALVKSICGQVPGLLENTTEFEAGLILSR